MLPYNRFLIALKSLGYNYREIQSILNSYKLPNMTEEHYIGINANDIDDWVLKLIDGWKDKDKYKTVFYKMLNNAMMRYKLMALLTANPNTEELAKTMKQNGLEEIDEESLELFKKWFWDIDETKEKDWDYFFEYNRFPGQILEKIQNALYGDKMLTYYENGIFPEPDPNAFLNGIVAVAYQKLRDMLADPVKRNRVNYNTAVKHAMKALEVLTARDKSGPSDVDPADIINILEKQLKFKNMKDFKNITDLQEKDDKK